MVLGKKIAVVTTNLFQPSSVRQSLQKAISLAKVQQPNDEFISLPGPKSIPEVETFSENLIRLTPHQKVKMVKSLLRRVKEKGCKASGAFSNGEVVLAVVNSLGVEAYQKFSDLFLHLIVENEKSSGYAGFVARDPDQLDVDSLAQEAIGKTSREEPIQIEPGEYEVILEPYAVTELLSFLGYLGFHALAVQEGRSFFSNRFGEKMVDEKVTIYDDGLDPEGLQVPFDFEGVPKKKVTFFDRGVAKEVTYDSFTAGREGKNFHWTRFDRTQYGRACSHQPFYEGRGIFSGRDDQVCSKGNLCDSIPLYQRRGTHESRHHRDDPGWDVLD